MNLSIRARLALTFSLLVGFLFAVFSGVLFGLVTHSLEADFRRNLEYDAKLINEILQEKNSLGLLQDLEDDLQDFDVGIQIFDANRKLLFQSDDMPDRNVPQDWEEYDAALTAPSWKTYRSGNTPQVALTKSFRSKTGGSNVIRLLSSRGDLNRIEHLFSAWIFSLLPVAMALAVLAGLFFSRKALAPIDTIRRKADEIRADDLSMRLPYPARRDELYFLTDTLNQLLDRISNAFLKIKMFTADASHELRIPLTVLKGSVDVALRKERTKEEYRETIETIREEVDRLSELVEDLLVLARTDAGQQTIVRAHVDLKEFLGDIMERAAILNRNNKVKLRLDPPPEGQGRFDANMVRRLLLNLVENAIKYTKAGGDVFVAARAQDGDLLMIVKDTGEGISPEEQARVFDRFYRTDKARAREEGGAGLGLAIARSIAEAHGGSLTLKSQKGEGSAFIVTLPN